MTPCTSTCPHGTTTCVLAAGHDGQHEVRGDRAPRQPSRADHAQQRGRRGDDHTRHRTGPHHHHPRPPVPDHRRHPSIEDCSFRMLTPHEIKQAMAFPDTYRILGTKRDQVRMAGNAVTPPAARDLIAAVAPSLEHT